MSIIVMDEATIHTTVCGIYRWPDKWMVSKSGPYYTVVVKTDVVRLLDMIGDLKWRHPAAVVDDFGNLVGVPA